MKSRISNATRDDGRVSRRRAAVRCFALACLATVACTSSPSPDFDVNLPTMKGVDAPLAEAVRTSARDLARNEDDPVRWAALADLLYAQQWYAEARDAYARAEEHGSNVAGVIYRRGRAAAMVGNPDEAIECVERVLASNDAYGPGWVFLGELLIDTGRGDEAGDAFRRALERAPREAVAARGLGQLALGRGEVDEALIWLERAVEWRPGYAEAHQSLSQAYLAVGNEYLAQEHARRTRDLPKRNAFEDPLSRPDVPPIGSQDWNDVGTERVRSGDLEAAEEAFRRSLEIRPENPQALYNLGTLLARTGRRRGAADALEQAVALRPNHVDSRVNLGAVTIELGDPESGRVHLERALDVNPDHPIANRALARLDAGRGDLDRAIERLSVASLGEDPDARRALGWLLLAAGRERESARTLRSAPPNEDPRWLDLEAALLAAAGRRRDA
ncbi:MAG: tetratricopeptide repeat protein, partial [Planctomycetota bacterium]|nr:tetratricopeptide repeat protein [Planctomycetota bacterium]